MTAHLKLALFPLIVGAIVTLPISAGAQGILNQSAYSFTTDCEAERTPVKAQGNTGTCWAFATISFLESEMLRAGKGGMDLSEMHVVRHVYPVKAENYVRLHGTATFGQGSLGHDAFACIQKYGLVPESVYLGRSDEKIRHDHTEMYTILKSMLDGVVTMKNGTLTPRWREACEKILDTYLGTAVTEFSYNGKVYTPQSFAREYLPVDVQAYIEVTSFAHHPFYARIRLELPDNWSCNDDYLNVPLDEMERIVDNALKNGHSVMWDGDMSEKFYATPARGYAIVPADDLTEIIEPVREKDITPEMRQEMFNNFSTTDDHLMHIIGLAHDQSGTKFYIAKDSWFSEGAYHGLLYLSRSYFRLKTISITINKEMLPANMRAKVSP